MSSKKSKKKPKAKAHGLNRNTHAMLILSGNPIWRALSKQPVSEQTRITIGLSGRKSLYALTNDAGQFEHCKELMVIGYAGIYLAEQGYGADLMNHFTAALATIKDCRSRACNGQAYMLDGLEARKVDFLLDMHEQQLVLADKAEVSDAIVASYGQAGVVM
jgi:hypothetical protein